MSETVLPFKCLEKTIRAADGTFRRLVSYDGVTWRMDAQKARLGMEFGTRVHGEAWKAKKEASLDSVAGRTGVKDHHPGILPVTHTASPILGRHTGKNQNNRPNLKRKKEKLVHKPASKPGYAGIGVVPRPVHSHFCRVHRGKFLCSCEQPHLSRRCGGKVCLHATLMAELKKGEPS